MELVENNELLQNIYKEFRHISRFSIYRTHLVLAVEIYCEYLNTHTITPINTGISNNETFAIKSNDRYVPNQKLLNKCFSRAEKGNCTMFSFMVFEVTLLELRKRLASRGKK